MKRVLGRYVSVRNFSKGQDIQGEVVYSSMVFGVQEGVGTPAIGETVRFFRSELAFLKA